MKPVLGMKRLNLDAADAVEIQAPEKTETSNDNKHGATMPKVAIDGIDYEAAPEVINALKRTGEDQFLSVDRA